MKKLELNKIQNLILRSAAVIGLIIVVVGIQPSKEGIKSVEKNVLLADKGIDGVVLTQS